MRFDVITLFPELFAPFLASGVTRRAYETGQVDVRLWNPREYAEGNYRRVDDRPFGGGPGMVMMAEPLARCVAAIRADRGGAAPLVLFSPTGRRLDHAGVQGWSAGAGGILLCGRYEGVDQRFIDAEVDVQLSLGDFVLSGGEVAAMALLDAVARLQPGVLNEAGSHEADSFNPAIDGLLDCPHYTRPEDWQGRRVPAELLSGHHARIERWRREQRLEATARLRPDLIDAARAAGRLAAADEAFLGSGAVSGDVCNCPDGVKLTSPDNAAMTARKDFSQVAFDVMRQATGEAPRTPSPAPEPQKKAAPKVTKGAAKKTAKKG